MLTHAWLPINYMCVSMPWAVVVSNGWTMNQCSPFDGTRRHHYFQKITAQKTASGKTHLYQIELGMCAEDSWPREISNLPLGLIWFMPGTGLICPRPS